MKKFALILAVLLLFLTSCTGEKSKEANADTNTTTNGATNASATSKGQETTVSGATSSTQSTTTLVLTTIGSSAGKTIKPTERTYPNTTFEPFTFPPTTALIKPVATNAAGYSKNAIGDKIVSPFTNADYTLTFIDQFTGTSLNTNNWTIDTGNYNASEEQANLAANVVVSNGYLNLYAKKDTVKHSRKTNWGSALSDTYFTGAAINSNKKVTYTYGRIEMLAKLPYSQGMWPAFWSMGTTKGWPWGGEIDIMEMVGGDDQWGNKNRDGQYNMSLHWCDPNAADPYGKDHKSTGTVYHLPDQASGAKLKDAWHVIGVEWTSTKMIGYIDNVKVCEYLITDPAMRDAFHKPHYMILDLVVGGGWAGSPDSYSPTIWPQNFQLDWVKIWQMK